MRKSEALSVIHRILDNCQESIIMTCVSIDAPYLVPNGNGYRIRIKCKLDSYSHECLKPILEEYNLTLTEENGYVTLSKQSASF